MDRKERYLLKMAGQAYQTWFNGKCFRCGGIYRRHDWVVEVGKRFVAHERCVFSDVQTTSIGDSVAERR